MSMNRTTSDLEGMLVERVPGDVDADVLLRRMHQRAESRRRRRWAGASIAVAVLTVGATVPALLLRGGGAQQAAFAGSCTVAPLVLPPGLDLPEPTQFASPDGTVTSSFVPAVFQSVLVDPTGRFIVAGIGAQSGPGYVVVWDNGTPTVYPVEATTKQLALAEVNSSGLIAATATPAGSDLTRAVLMQDGVVNTLPLPDGFVSGSAAGTNEAGVVVGTVSDSKGRPAGVVWAADPQHTPRLVEAPGVSLVVDIADDGTMVGEAGTMVGDDPTLTKFQPYVWSTDGIGSFLPLPSDVEGGWVARIRGDFAVGTVLKAAPGGSEPLDVVWNLRTGSWRVMARGGPPTRVNANGDLVTGWGNNFSQLIRDGLAYELPPADPTMVGGHAFAYDLTDDATLVVGVDATVKLGDNNWGGGVVWHC
jgi:hypothetical protein